jgi:hypothetical protein
LLLLSWVILVHIYKFDDKMVWFIVIFFGLTISIIRELYNYSVYCLPKRDNVDDGGSNLVLFFGGELMIY